MDIKSQISLFASCIGIAHHIPGRIRFKLNLRQMGQPEMPSLKRAQDFLKTLGDIRGVHAIRVNPVALSCVIEYDPSTIPPQAWPDFMQGTPSNEAGVLMQIVEQKYAELSQKLKTE
jgi:hypothetical protein